VDENIRQQSQSSGLRVFSLPDCRLQSGTPPDVPFIAYRTVGELNEACDNAVLIPSHYAGTDESNDALFGPGRSVDPDKHFVVLTNMFGNGRSWSPSNWSLASNPERFPVVTVRDNVRAQHRLLVEGLGVRRLALVMGWSMGAMQAFEWATQFPTFVDSMLAYCGTPQCSPHNYVFLEGLRLTLGVDEAPGNGRNRDHVDARLRAFARVYAGWAYSQEFYRDQHHRRLGMETIDDVLHEWEQDHLRWDPHDLFVMLRSWQEADISRNAVFLGDIEAALRSIKARSFVIACSSDLYFPPEDTARAVRFIDRATFRVVESPLGHAVGSPGLDPMFGQVLDDAAAELLERRDEPR
jgi:homoserine O-acetyltransferase